MTSLPTTLSHSSKTTEVWRASRFAIVGLTGLAVNSGLLWLLTEHLNLYYLASSVLATEAATVNNFALNHLWTFSRSHRTGSLFFAFLRYNAVAVGYMALTVFALFVLTHYVGLHYLVANPLAVGVSAAWNYVMCRCWVWGTNSPQYHHLAQEPAND